jgi:hypothetical protein
MDDVNLIIANFGKSGGDIQPPEADVNKDGYVNAYDLSVVMENVGK